MRRRTARLGTLTVGSLIGAVEDEGQHIAVFLRRVLSLLVVVSALCFHVVDMLAKLVLRGLVADGAVVGEAAEPLAQLHTRVAAGEAEMLAQMKVLEVSLPHVAEVVDRAGARRRLLARCHLLE